MGKETPELQLVPHELRAVSDALHRVQAVIEFDLKGKVLHANDNFLKAMGYTLEDIRGQHHRIFCEPAYAASAEYKKFWENLGKGVLDRGEYKRIGGDGREVWINASYNPVFDENGKPYKVIKFATDVTANRQQKAEFEGKVNAIDKAQAMIEFDLGGHVISANDNFLKAMGYELEDIQGHHHRMFCEDSYTASAAYADFWAKLNRGEFDAGRYKRLGKGGRVIWIQATYNPIYDGNGRLSKVVKFATDVTAQVAMEEGVKLRAADDQRKVEALLKTVRLAAEGDLTGEVRVEGSEPIDQLADGIQQMMSDLRSVIGKVVDNEIGRAHV